MSWITPVVRQLINDKLMSRHQTKFFENGATPNMVISMDAAVSYEQFKKFKEQMNLEHRGVENAYKTLTVGGGADVTIAGLNFEQMAFTDVMGRGETRLAAAAGVPPVIAGFSEGLQGSSLNAGNYKASWRRFTDGTMVHLWANMCGSLQEIVPPPDGGSRLWYDTGSVPSLREDAMDMATIMETKAKIVRTLGDGGWDPESVKQFVMAEDFGLLKHSGRLSVQLQEPGAVEEEAPAAENDAPEEGTEDDNNVDA
jgi:phage portal protein BeeE